MILNHTLAFLVRKAAAYVLLSAMPVVICLLRGVNVGGHAKIKMDVLRGLCESVGGKQPRTYIQSGNVIFKIKECHLKQLAQRIEDAIERKLGFRPAVILRTRSDLAATLAANPFARRRDIDPSKLLITFLAEEPGASARKELDKIDANPEEMKIKGKEVYIYFPNGMGRSKFPWPRVAKILGSTGTGRNWNTANKLLEMAKELEGTE